jgi:hypothetical protein
MYVFLGMPFVFSEPVVIMGVNYSEFTLCEWDFSESITVAQAAIQQYQKQGRPFEPSWDFENYLDDFNPHKL